MEQFFVICAIIGGTILVLQVGLSLLGMGSDLGGDLGHGGFIGHGGDLGHGGHTGHAGAGAGAGDGQGPGVDHEGMSALGKKLTFQTIVAFVTFFGIGGRSALGFGWSAAASLAVAVVTGLAAMVLLAYAFGGLRRLQGNGTLRLSNAIGESGRVYLRIPGGNGGVGKVVVPVQGRTAVLQAATPGPELRTGDAVVVTRVLDDRTLEVVAEAAYVEKSASLVD